MYSIETIDLVHKFSDNETALNSINLQVIENTIYGFLVPNGAGKTTTLKLILGLLKRQRGEILIFGKPFETNRVEALRRIGSMIESPSLYGQGTLAELVGKQRQSSFIIFETSDDAAARLIITAFGISSRVETGRIATPVLEKTTVAAINRRLMQNDVEVYQISKIENDLEKIFFDVIGE